MIGRRSAQNTPVPRNTLPTTAPAAAARAALSAVIVVALCCACGKKGPPLPPLVKLPVAPADLAAERRGDTVDLRFTVPATNTDGTRPANIERAEIYAITAAPLPPPQTLTDAQIVKYGTRVATVDVKAPRDPNLTADPEDPSDEVDAPVGAGLDQGAVAHVEDDLADDTMKEVTVPPDPNQPPASKAADDEAPRPLLGPSPVPPSRTYAVLGVSTRGRKGPLSRRVAVPLVPPPPPPGAPTIAYTEQTITVTWPAAPGAAAAGDDVLPSHPIGAAPAPVTFNVYDATDPDALVKLTTAPLTEPKYADARIEWGAKRCYAIRSTTRIGNATIESEAGPIRCETLVDTFAPAAPKGLASIPSDGAINLIWDPNAEKDLAGYIVLRGPVDAGPDAPLAALTPAPIQETRFTDTVPAGVAYVYAVKAVDAAGNASATSARVTETAR